MWCSNCGSELTEGTKFCSNCGTAVSDTGNTITVNPAVTDLPAKPKKKTGRVIILSLILGVIACNDFEYFAFAKIKSNSPIYLISCLSSSV